MFDVVFLYNQEKNGKKNYKRLLKAAPWAQCVKNAPSISSAHHQAAQIAKTEWFFTVDGDNFVLNDEIFSEKIFWKKYWHLRAVGVFRAKNPTNGAVYGWGGIKFWNKTLLREIPKNYQDFTTSFPMYAINDVASCHHYNVSSWDTWRSVFREVFKLMMKRDEESKQRLKLWLDPYDCFDFKDEYLNACVWAWEWIKKFKTLAAKNHNDTQEINASSNIDIEFINSLMQCLKQRHMNFKNANLYHDTAYGNGNGDVSSSVSGSGSDVVDVIGNCAEVNTNVSLTNVSVNNCFDFGIDDKNVVYDVSSIFNNCQNVSCNIVDFTKNNKNNNCFVFNIQLHHTINNSRSNNNIAHYFATDSFDVKEFNVNSWDFLKKQYDIAFVRTFDNG